MKFIKEFVVNKVSDSEAFGVDLRTSDSNVVQFRGASAFFADSLSRGLTRELICHEALNKFQNVSEEQIEADFDRFVSYLEHEKLLER